jgi:hypothetical protein
MQHHSPCRLLISHDQWGLTCPEPPFHHLGFESIQNVIIKANKTANQFKGRGRQSGNSPFGGRLQGGVLGGARGGA